MRAIGHELDDSTDAATAPVAPEPEAEEETVTPVTPAPVQYTAEDIAERKRMASLMADKGTLTSSAVGDGEASVIANLRRTVEPTDTILNVVPMCAPMMTVMPCKYKIRLVPGKLKKGKAAKAAVHQLLGWSQCQGAEREFVKGLADEELVRVMVRRFSCVRRADLGTTPVECERSTHVSCPVLFLFLSVSYLGYWDCVGLRLGTCVWLFLRAVV